MSSRLCMSESLAADGIPRAFRGSGHVEKPCNKLVGYFVTRCNNNNIDVHITIFLICILYKHISESSPYTWCTHNKICWQRRARAVTVFWTASVLLLISILAMFDIQLLILTTPDVGLAGLLTAIPSGETNDCHPINNQPASLVKNNDEKIGL